MLADIQKHLAGHPWQRHIHWLDSVDSTNSYARNLADQGAPEGTVVIADFQTGGRGRMGRCFHSPAGMGIYLSLILRPNCDPEQLMHLTCAVGVAAGDAVNAVTGRTPGIKWTNDLILDRRKLGGILTELSLRNGKVEYAIIGIGINCRQRPMDFPPDIRPIAISLGLSEPQQSLLSAALIRQLHTMNRELFCRKQDTMAIFRRRCITLGQEISLVNVDRIRHGTALDVDDDGGLTVAFADGKTETVTSGEVSIRGMYGYV